MTVDGWAPFISSSDIKGVHQISYIHCTSKHKHKSQQNYKVAAIYKNEKGIFFLYFSPESQNMQIIIWGRERREREKACVRKYLETAYLEILSMWHVTSVLYL